MSWHIYWFSHYYWIRDGFKAL